MYSFNSLLKIFHPSLKCLSRENDLYCVKTTILRNPEFRQLLNVKSITLYIPPKGTAGFALSFVSGYNLSPWPPARIMVSILSCTKVSSEKVVKDIHRRTHKKYSSEEKIRIVLEGLRGEESISNLCRRVGMDLVCGP